MLFDDRPPRPAPQTNELAAIPAAFSQLKRIKTLQLDNNRIFAVPPDVLFGCTALQTLSLHGCPIKPDELQVGAAAAGRRGRPASPRWRGGGPSVCVFEALSLEKGLAKDLINRTTCCGAKQHAEEPNPNRKHPGA